MGATHEAPPGVKARIHEREGSAGERLADRHRMWGIRCPATDLDLVMLEMTARDGSAVVVAIVEYKAGLKRKLTTGEKFCVRGIRRLADQADIPAFVVKHSTDAPYRFAVFPLGLRAAGMLPADSGGEISEREYVDWLYRIRGHDQAPPEVREALAS